MKEFTENILRRCYRAYQKQKLPAVVRSVTQKRLSYIEPSALHSLMQEVERIEREKIPGSILELGVALGGSTVVMATAKNPARPLHCYDTFGLIPAPSEQDGPAVKHRYEVIASGQSKGIGGDPYYGYQSDLLGQVKQSLAEFGWPFDQNAIHFHPGLYQDTLQVTSDVALAHLDCDWYESVFQGCERIAPKLVQGGSIIVDDYYTYDGCKAAIWDYFRHKLSDFRFDYGNRLRIVKR